LSGVHPPLDLLSPSEYDPLRPSSIPSTTALLGFLPLQRLRSWKPGRPGLASSGTFRPQGFSPSRRFPSSRTFRPCFMPVTLLGFSLQGLFPSQSLRHLSMPAALSTLAPLKRMQELKPCPQGLSLCEDPTPPARREPPPEAAALLVFPPSKGLTLAVFRRSRNDSPHELSYRRGKPRRYRLSRVSRPTRLARLSRDCRPF
jgi:hypothetical protein